MNELSYVKNVINNKETELEIADATARENVEKINDSAVFSEDIRNILLVTAMPSDPVSTTLYILIDG